MGSRFRLGIALGLIVGLVTFGTTGCLVGAWAFGSGSMFGKPAPSQSAGPGTGLGPYAQSRVALNSPKFTGDLATFSRPWFAVVSLCYKNGDPGGPTLSEDEEIHIFCTKDGISFHFVQYRSIAARDKARARNLEKNVDARQLAPGVAEPTQRRTASGASSGSYVEFATNQGGDRPGRTIVAGIWWDNTDTPVACYLLAFWIDGLGESWEPLRDLWQHSS